jgi:hypothetical protein
MRTCSGTTSVGRDAASALQLLNKMPEGRIHEGILLGTREGNQDLSPV